jgi:hypothetical protein
MTRIYRSVYKDVNAVCIDTGRSRALFLPDHGAKMASLIDDASGMELLVQNGSVRYKAVRLGDSYTEGECSAFDDMFPTIDPVMPAAGIRKDIEYCDHGEACRSHFDMDITGNRLEMSYTSQRLKYRYAKTVSGDRDGSVNIRYVIENLTGEAFPILWAGHCMVNASEGGMVITPFKDCAEAKIIFDETCGYGAPGSEVRPGREMLTSGRYGSDGNTYKFYYTGRIPEGYAGYRFLKEGRTIYLSYDKDKLPYLGIWVNNGRFKGMYNVAVEPSTCCGDTPDMSGSGMSIGPGGKFTFDLNISIR